MKVVRLLIIFFCVLFVVACKTKVPVTEMAEEEEEVFLYVPAFTENYPEFKSHILQDLIHASLLKESKLKDFYLFNDCMPVWVKDTLNITGLNNLILHLESSSKHGIDADYFQTAEMRNLIDSVQQGLYKEQTDKLYDALLRLEYLSVQSLVDYSTGMQYGFVIPEEIFAKNYNIAIKKPDSTYYKSLFGLIKENPDSLLLTIHPQDPTYKKIQEALFLYEARKDSVFEKITPRKSGNYKLKEKSKEFALIAKRLMLTGELEYSSNPDSLYATLTPDLLDAVNRFRKNNSYPEEKEIGKITIDALNRPMSYYYDKAKANLERYRWKRQTPASDKYIEVNVAAFNLKAIESGKDALLMNVCVGTVKNATPLLESNITYINLNPQWNVPKSIVQKEIYYSIKKDSTYLQRNRMKLLKNGEEVDPATVDWASVESKSFPYHIRQDAWGGNSLGRIKFIFKNSFSVYLHDTPSKRTFSAKNRAVSHGCVRLQKPVDLAYFCIENIDSLYLDRIRYSIDYQPETREGKRMLKKGQLKKVKDIINLDTPVPVFIDYYTAYLLPEEEQLYFADDVYSFDKKILTALDERGLN